MLLSDKETLTNQQKDLSAALEQAQHVNNLLVSDIHEINDKVGQTNLQKEIIDSKAKSYNELMDVRFQTNKAENEVKDL